MSCHLLLGNYNRNNTMSQNYSEPRSNSNCKVSIDLNWQSSPERNCSVQILLQITKYQGNITVRPCYMCEANRSMFTIPFYKFSILQRMMVYYCNTSYVFTSKAISSSYLTWRGSDVYPLNNTISFINILSQQPWWWQLLLHGFTCTWKSLRFDQWLQ